ncbi:TonB-dependent receptor [Acinetobacter sp. VNH17]|uniref:TonB-dependent receptor n=1 Tax=Acinetobacter thutiue TaxID=2998078 RepID=A0ABT7WSY3_9GAMM|nr:TonB-dependent receptor [Acinetobacter thutiue]MCY6413698.1 TonB-dependent receptor [Acinetobacter thutiue]MDN0015807.1 TonB-dependent receptor [Acinetobacter thutiue]
MYAQQGKNVLAQAIRIAVLSTALGISVTAYAANEQAQQHYEIKSGQLGQALSSFAMQSGVALSFDPALTKGMNTQGLSGSYSIADGFEQLLKGTQLQLVQRDHGGWSIEKIKSTPQRSKPVREVGQLNSIAVNGVAQSAVDGNASQLPVIKVAADDQPVGLKKRTQSGVLGNKSILDTPFSVTVIESNDIAKRGAKTLGQIFINDPAVYSQSAAMATDWWGTSVRGLGVSNYYVDGFPMALNWGGDFPSEAAESVTVLKGLTGFMYGFGSPGGAISYQLKRPKDSPETSVEVSYRNPSTFSALIDTSNYLDAVDLGYRFVVGGDQGKAYNDAEQNRFVTSLALDKKITDHLMWTANFTYENNKTEHEPPVFDFSAITEKLPKVTYDYDNLTVDNSFYKTNTFTASTGLGWEINEDWNVKYQFGYTRKLHESNLTFASLLNTAGDYDGTIYQFAGVSETLMNQAMLTGNFATGKIQHELVAGGGYTKSTDRWSKQWYWSTDYTANLYSPTSFRIANTPDFSLEPDIGSQTAQSYAFLSDTIKLNEQWQAILGLRHTYYDQEDVDHDPTVDSGYNTKETTPTIALLYKFVPEATLYASYVESLEAGSRVGEKYANAGEVLPATISKQYELGVKYDVNPFGITAALFKMQRAATMDSIQDGLKYLTQDGLTNYQGLELSGTYKPTNALKLGLGMMYLDASIDEVAEANKAIEGKVPAGLAKWSGVANAEYAIQAIDGLSLHGNVRYNGSSYISSDNSIQVPAYTLVNTGLSYKFKLNGHDAVVNGNINNLLNKKYWASSGTWASIGEAINGVVSLKVNW